MKYNEFYNKVPKNQYKKKTFKNMYGERFYVIYPKVGIGTPLVTGDEYDWEMLPLFNSKFDLYTDEEVREIGKALQELSAKKIQEEANAFI